jgi:hypothetical protein
MIYPNDGKSTGKNSSSADTPLTADVGVNLLEMVKF